MTTSKRTPVRRYMAGMVHCANCRGTGWIQLAAKTAGEPKFRVCSVCRGKGKIKA